MADSLEINGLVLRLDYLIHKLVNFVNAPQTDEIILLLLLYFKGWSSTAPIVDLRSKFDDLYINRP